LAIFLKITFDNEFATKEKDNKNLRKSRVELEERGFGFATGVYG